VLTENIKFEWMIFIKVFYWFVCPVFLFLSFQGIFRNYKFIVYPQELE